MIATNAADSLRALGAEVIGPVAHAAEALDVIETFHAQLDAALLDINLNGQMIYPVAAFLRMHNIPFAFVTGYEDQVLPPFYRGTLMFTKPADWGGIASQLTGWNSNLGCSAMSSDIH